MNESLLSSGQFMTFATLLGAGLTYVLVTSILGFFFGGHGENSHDGDSAEHVDGTVSVFSSRIVAIFMIGFGAGGLIATHYGLSIITATLIGLSCGVGIGILALLGLRLLYSQQANSEISIVDTVGRIGTISVDIPENHFGEIDVAVKGQIMTYRARSNRYLPRGVSVLVKSVQNGELIVG